MPGRGNDSFRGASMTGTGREVQFADGDSGRSINRDKRRRTQCRLQAPERSLNRTDWRRADDCYGAHTVHRGSRRHRQQPLQSGLHGQSKPYVWAQPRLASIPGSSLSYAKANAELTAMRKRELGK